MRYSPFLDMTEESFRQRLNLKVTDMAAARSQMERYNLKNESELPTSFDWRQKGAVNHVKDQGQCGSCWAFSAVGNLEGVNFVTNGKLVEFSEQQLVDCDHNGDEGCNGGLMDNAFKYIQDNGGLDTEQSYPYTARDGKCKFNKDTVGVRVTGFEDISSNEDEIAKVLMEVGPLAIAVNANPFQFYSG